LCAGRCHLSAALGQIFGEERRNDPLFKVKCIALLTASVDEQDSNPSTRRRLLYPFTTPVFVGWARTPFQQQLDDARLLLA
jgi:hypothetical protein